MLRDVDPGEAAEELQGGQAGVEVGLPAGDEAVTHQVGRAHEQGVRRVCTERRKQWKLTRKDINVWTKKNWCYEKGLVALYG